MALEAAILSVVIALIRRGKLLRLADLEVKHFWMIYIPAILLFASVFGRLIVPKTVWVPVSGWLHILATVAFLVVFVANITLPGMKWLLTGWTLNLVPILANSGKMPVSYAAAKMANVPKDQLAMLLKPMMRHVLMTSHTRANFLADIIPTPKPPSLINPCVNSIGDILMAVGLFILIQVTMCPRKTKDKADCGNDT